MANMRQRVQGAVHNQFLRDQGKMARVKSYIISLLALNCKEVRAMAGYSKLADLMASHQELSLFKQFAALNFKNLLIMQSELIYLEQELLSISVGNLASHDSSERAFEFSIFDLKESAGSLSDSQWQKTLEIRKKLKNYSIS
ncbi:MAG: hypothetical protein Q9167_003877 [Letrouitia subvulpina]